MFVTSSRSAFSSLSPSIRRARDSLRGSLHGAGNERAHPPMDSAAREQLALRISTIDGVPLTQARQQIDRFRGISLPDVPRQRTTVGSTARPLNHCPSLGIAMV
ncbi:MAG: hypothetical protein ABI593_02220 [Betaproteobacteria bacterium]